MQAGAAAARQVEAAQIQNVSAESERQSGWRQGSAWQQTPAAMDGNQHGAPRLHSAPLSAARAAHTDPSASSSSAPSKWRCQNNTASRRRIQPAGIQRAWGTAGTNCNNKPAEN